MSGHSKWNNIKNKKEKTDAQKAKVFTKIGKEIAIAVRAGGPDPNVNRKLKDLIAKAKSLNVPNDNIERSIKKASGADGVAYEEITYEGYGPSGIAVIVETLGSEGAKVFFGDQVIRVNGIRVKAVDATGAGDAFWGAFLSSLRIQGVEKAADFTEEILKNAIDYGNVSGCICVQSKGAIASIPTRAQIEAYLKEHFA